MLNNINGLALYSALTLYLIVVGTAQAHEDIDLQIVDLSNQIEENSNKAELYLERAELHRIHQDWENAIKDYDSAEKYGITKTSLNFHKGRMFAESGQEDKALLHINQVLASNPDHVPALIERSNLSSQPASSSAQDLDRAIALMNSPPPDLILNRAKFTMENDAEDIDKMIAGLEQGIQQIGPLVSLVEYGIAKSEEHSQWQTAYKMLEHLPIALRQSPKWMLKEGQIMEQLDNRPGAMELYQNALSKIQKLPLSRSNSEAMLRLKQEIIETQKSHEKDL